MRRMCIEGALAFAVTIGFFSVLGMLLTHPFPLESKDVLLVLLGALGAQWNNAMSYYFGSSSGSAQKTALLGKTNAQSGTQGS